MVFVGDEKNGSKSGESDPMNREKCSMKREISCNWK